jgi:Carboxypeptidase regulatory-like domain/TonB dependent receptor/TonB-dependent Receptor Plug Domain
MTRWLRAAFAASCVLVVVPRAGVASQAATGTILGAVSDETGAMLPGVTVTVTNSDTSLVRTLVTDPGGRYAAPNLPPGPYVIKATLQGFGTVLRAGITLTVGREAVVDLTMKVGQMASEVTVTADAPSVDLKTSSTGSVITGGQIQAIPLNGRSYVELTSLTPGVLIDQTGNQSTSNGFGVKLAVNGARYTSNLFTLDGTSMNDEYNQAGSASGNLLGVDSIREFQVLTNSFSAEYGHHTGGIVNAATKSGANTFQGSAFEFHRDSAMDAKNFFDVVKPEFQRNQFGASLGGPIVRNETFFFVNFEGLHERLGSTRSFNVPSDLVRSGGAGAINPAILPWLLSYPQANGPAIDANRGVFSLVTTRKTDESYVTMRVDQKLSPASQLFVRYTFNDSNVVDPGGTSLDAGSNTKTRLQYLTTEHNWVARPSLVNRFQFGFTRSRLDGYDSPREGAPSLPASTFTSYNDGLPTLTITGLNALGGDTTNPKYHRFNNFQFRDSVTWQRRAHSVKIGGDVQYLQYYLKSDFTSMGQYVFTSIPNFLRANANQFNAVMPGSDATRDLRQLAYGLYLQDDIQLRKTLTLNVGVRYEPNSSITDTKGRLAQLIDFASPTATLNDTTVLPDGLFKNPSLKTVAPRIGFAWDVNGAGTTAIRGGAGIFYDDVLLSQPFIQNTAVRVPPFINRGGLVSGPSLAIDFPNAYTTQAAQLAATTQLEGIDYHLRQPYVQKWNIEIQRQILGRTTVELGYSGAHGVHLVRQVFTNGRIATLQPDGSYFAPPTEPLAQPNFGRMRLRISDGASQYYGLNASVTRRLANGFQAQVAYTYSKSTDDGAAALGGTDFSTEGGGSRYLLTKDPGLSPFDLRHSLVGSVSYTLPFAANSTGITGALAKGWNASVLVRLRSGYPFSAISGVDTGGQGQGWAPDYVNVKPGASDNPVYSGGARACTSNPAFVCWFDPTAFSLPATGYTGTVRRNSIEGPGQATVDLNFNKTMTLTGTRKLQVRVEAFNLANRVNFGVPSNTIFNPDGSYNANAGRITTTQTPGRQIQLGLRFTF